MVGAAIPLTVELAVYAAGWDLLRGVSDSDKYYRLALRIFDTGMFGIVDPGTGAFLPELDAVAGYPYFLAAAFALFGRENYWAVGVVQALLAGLAVPAIALAARAIKDEWLVPAGMLAAVWPNLAYRPATILSETLFTFFISWGLCAALWAAKARRPLWLLVAAGIGLGLAYLTRPVLMGFPFIVTPGLAMLLYREQHRGWSPIIFAAVPIAVMLTFTVPNYVRSYQAYGAPMFTLQQGHNLLFYIYPCLAADWGCGNPDLAAGARAQAEYERAMTPELEANVVARNDIETGLASRLIGELTLTQFAKAIVGSTAKLLLHNTSYEILQRFEFPVRYWGEAAGDGPGARVRSFAADIAATPSMLIWAAFQVFLLLSRAVQVVGAVRMLLRPALLGPAVFLLAYMAAILAVSIGFGNPRYRVPLEPGLILFTVAGLDFLWARGRRGRSIAAPAVGPAR